MKLLISAAVLLGLSQAAFGWLVEPLASTCSSYPGCYRDDQARIWPTDSTDPGKRIILGTTNSPPKCSEKCVGYAFFGVQGINACWCGNTAPPRERRRPESECHEDCPGDSNYKCGASWRMNIHQQAYQGCYEDDQARIWPTEAKWIGSETGKRIILGTTNSPPKCSEECRGYVFFGVQAKNACWCGNTAPPADRKRPESECHEDCPGDSNYKCGGSWRMNIHKQSKKQGFDVRTQEQQRRTWSNFVYDSDTQCKHGCGRQDSTCQVWKSLVAIREWNPRFTLGIDKEYFEHMMTSMANRKENMAFTSCDNLPCGEVKVVNWGRALSSVMQPSTRTSFAITMSLSEKTQTLGRCGPRWNNLEQCMLGACLAEFSYSCQEKGCGVAIELYDRYEAASEGLMCSLYSHFRYSSTYTMSYDFKEYEYCDNDKAKSLKILWAEEGNVIKICDNNECKNDDYTIITVKKRIPCGGWVLSGDRGFERNLEDSYVKMEKFGGGNLNGKVSRVELLKKAPTFLEQRGEECWEYCDGTEGPCHYCGSEGLCCRYDKIRDKNSGCAYQEEKYSYTQVLKKRYTVQQGELITGKHVCVTREPPEYSHIGQECWDECNKKEGGCIYCGDKGMCCRKDQVKDDNSGCRYGMGIEGKHTCTEGCLVEKRAMSGKTYIGDVCRFLNEGKKCYSKCGEGLCEGGNFCGHTGRCCRANQIMDWNSGCRYGMGGENDHTCTHREEDLNTKKDGAYVRDPTMYANLGYKTCWNKEYNGKKYQEGYNPFCGTNGLCCRFNQIKNKASGCDPLGNGKGIGIEGKNYHHCVRPLGAWEACMGYDNGCI